MGTGKQQETDELKRRKKMPYNYDDKNVRCPFYQYERDNKIYCEGLIKNSVTSTNFKNKSALKEHKNGICSEAYKDCPLYKALTKKYE